MATTNIVKIAIKPGVTVTESAEKALTDYATWTTVSQEWATNPDTGSAWTWEEIATLQIGVALKQEFDYTDSLRCTQVYVEIEYTPAPVVTAINIGDAWKAIDWTGSKINVGDAWKATRTVKVNIGDAWKRVYSSPAVLNEDATYILLESGTDDRIEVE
jgi:hypothetical protein